MGGRQAKAIGVLGFAVLTVAAFPARAQEPAPLLFLSDRHGETVCDQSWFDIYEMTLPPEGSGSPSVSFGAVVAGPAVALGRALAAQEAAEVRRITDADAQIPDAEAYCAIGYHHAEVSPDGSAIAAIRREGSSQVVVVMNRDGSEQRIVSHPNEFHATRVSWAPDSRRLVHDGHDVPGLKIVSLDGGEATVIPNTQFSSDPAWSHDGGWIAFTFTPEQDNPDFHAAVGVIAPDGTGFRQVTLDAPAAKADRPAWSPDDSEIAFSTLEPSSPDRACGDDHVSIVPFTGAATYETLPVPPDMCRSGGPAWLTKATLAFWGAIGEGEPNPDLYVMQRGDESSLVQLTNDPAVDLDPAITSGTAAIGEGRPLPRTGGEDGTPATTEDATPAASRTPILLGGLLVLVIIALVAGKTVLATAGARAARAKQRTPERERDRSSGHAEHETRWREASERARAERSNTAAVLDESLRELRSGWNDLIVSLEQARDAFRGIDPTEPDTPPDEEKAVVHRLLAGLADIPEEGPTR